MMNKKKRKKRPQNIINENGPWFEVFRYDSGY